jgi:MFS family permease
MTLLKVVAIVGTGLILTAAAVVAMLSATLVFSAQQKSSWRGIGCPHFGRRKPVLIGGASFLLLIALAILYLPHDIIPPYLAGLLLGIGSGAAMIPYTIIKEVNADEVKGSATGAINFLVFTLSALMAPIYGWVLVNVSNGGPLDLPVFQKAGIIGVGGIFLAIVLSCFIRETGTSVLRRKTSDGPSLQVVPVLGAAQ